MSYHDFHIFLAMECLTGLDFIFNLSYMKKKERVNKDKVVYKSTTVKPLYSEHQRDCWKSVHYRRCSLYGGFVLNELLHLHKTYVVCTNDKYAVSILDHNSFRRNELFSLFNTSYIFIQFQ